MQVGFLCTYENISNWFLSIFPNSKIYTSACEDLFYCDIIIITQTYTINKDHYQIFDAWKYFLSIRGKQKKLIVLGWTNNNSSNWICHWNPPHNLDNFFLQALNIKQKPSYPKFVDKNILDRIEKSILSHGNFSFQKLLIQLREAFLKAEKLSVMGLSHQEVFESKEGIKVREVFELVENKWNTSLHFFQLIPQYPVLLDYEKLRINILTFLKGEEANKNIISNKINEYLDISIRPIILFYKFEQNIYAEKR